MSDAQETPVKAERHHLTKVGVVTSNKMKNTVVVAVERLRAHPIYGRTVRRSKRFVAHDASDACQIGDKVLIVESRPLSKRKRWRVKQVIEKATPVG